MEISKIEKADLPALQQLYLQLVDIPSDMVAVEKIFAQIDANPSYHLLGTKLDGRLVGTLMGIVCHDLVGNFEAFMVIENVIVAEEYRGRGIAKGLFARIEEIAVEQSCSYICFVSGNNRTVAHQA